MQYAFRIGKTEVVFMVDKDAKYKEAKEQEAALAVGFRVTGHYQGYKMGVV